METVLNLNSIMVIVFRVLMDIANRLAAFLRPEETVPVITNRVNKGARDLVLVMDVSPSMLERDYPPSRLDAARTAADALIQRLCLEEPDARVALVAFGGEAKVISRLKPVLSLAEEADPFARMTVTNATNITSGLQHALKLLTDHTRPCQVVLLTDGVHNKGPQPLGTAVDLKKFAILDCVGIGSRPEVDEELLREMASVDLDGTKHYRWIGDPEQLRRHFHDLGGGICRE